MRKALLHSLIGAVVICLLPVAIAAQEAKILTPEFVEGLKSVGAAQISPDGAWIAYTVTVPRAMDEPSGSPYTELWLMPYGGGAPRAFATGKGRLGAIAWAPNGTLISFIADRGQGAQVYGLPFDGGEAMPFTKSATGVSQYRWSPDSSKIAYLAVDDWSEAEKQERKAGRDMQLVEENYRYARIHIVDSAGGGDRVVTPAEYNVWDFNWSPDGASIVVTASDEATTDASYMLKKLWIVSAADGSRKLLCETAGKLSTPVWSPDGTRIAWGGAIDITDPYQGSLFVCTVADGKPVNLTGAAEETLSSVEWIGADTLACTAIRRQHVVLFTVAADGSNRKMVVDGANSPMVGHPGYATGGKFAAAANTAMHPNELFAGDLNGKLVRLTDSNPDLKNYRLGEQTEISYPAGDGTTIEGILIFPVDFQKGTRYPLIVQPHGGPEGAYLNGWITSYSQWSQMLAQRGYFVFAPNYRGSIGRGVAFSKADHKDLGGKEFQDVIDGIDYLIAQGYVDGARVGSGGGSYGGYFSALAATKASERFAAAVVFAGITDWYSNQGTSDIPLENAEVHWNIRDWQVAGETMWKASPVAYIAQANTATLIAHGERDQRVPTTQGYELFRALKFHGTPVQMVVYPRAGHGLGENQHRVDYARRVLEWFDTYVKNRK